MLFGAVKRLFGQPGKNTPATTGNALSSQAGLAAGIRSEMMRFDQMVPGLGKKALAYVTHGENPAIVEFIRKECGSANYAGTAWYTSQAAKDEPALRGRFFAKGDYPVPEIFVRYLDVLQAKSREYRPYGAKPEQTPPRVALYVNSVKSGLITISQTEKMPWENVWQSQITPLRIFHTVKQLGGVLVDFFGLILEGRNRYPGTLEGELMNHPETIDLISKYPKAVETSLERLSPEARAALAKLMQERGWLLTHDFQGIVHQILAGKSASVDRSTLVSALAACDADALTPVLENTFNAAGIETRLALVEIITRNGASVLTDILRTRAPREKAAKVRAAIEVALDGANIRAADVAETQNEVGPDGSGYRAIDGTTVVIPPFEVPADEAIPALPAGFRAEYEKHVAHIDQDRAARLAHYREVGDWERRSLQPVTEAEREAGFSLIAELIPMPQDLRSLVGAIDYSVPGGSSWLARAFERLPDGLKLRAACLWLPNSLASAVKDTSFYEPKHNFSPRKYLRTVLTEKNIDLRVLSTLKPDLFLSAHLATLPVPTVWPYIAENLAALDAALGLAPGASSVLNRQSAVACLKMLPKLPERYFRTLLDLGVTEREPLRSDCRALLRSAPQLEDTLIALLDDSRAAVRIETALWLADARLTGANTSLFKRLAKEKSDGVRTTLIQALQRLGADLSSIIGAEALIKEAEAGLKSGKNKIPDWFDVNILPQTRFRNGSPLPHAVLTWWCALATKMKDPAATARFGLYLDQLVPEDARAISNQILDGWIKYDTHGATAEEAGHYAAAHAQERFTTHQRWSRDYTFEKAFADLKRERLAELPNSGSESKGLLALACRADPVRAAQQVQNFLKKHGRRSNQAMALLDVLGGIAEPAALQVVIAASVRLKQKSTQKHATDLVTRFAEDRGWTVEELADRTVPTAGFDDDGCLDLPCGVEDKPYAACLDGLTIRLRNPDGRDITALPAGDDQSTLDSRKAYSDAKKELKQIIELQTARLKEAMCHARSWPALDWVSFFHDHPVMRQLIEKLVWEGLSEDSSSKGLFRLTATGNFIGLDAMAVSLAGFTHIRLAHGALVDLETAQSWETHVKNSEMLPLMPQFGGVRIPLADVATDQTEITDRKGWMTDSFTLRGITAKLGYEKIAGDGGGCNEFEKVYPALGLIAQVSYTGSHAVEEENIPAALIALSFRTRGGSGRYGQACALASVPAVLRAECHADYHAMAAKAAFDPDWEKKSPW